MQEWEKCYGSSLARVHVSENRANRKNGGGNNTSIWINLSL